MLIVRVTEKCPSCPIDQSSYYASCPWLEREREREREIKRRLGLKRRRVSHLVLLTALHCAEMDSGFFSFLAKQMLFRLDPAAWALLYLILGVLRKPLRLGRIEPHSEITRLNS
jgi:hypothetical protein